jgi:hypothetical protein
MAALRRELVKGIAAAASHRNADAAPRRRRPRSPWRSALLHPHQAQPSPVAVPGIGRHRTSIFATMVLAPSARRQSSERAELSQESGSDICNAGHGSIRICGAETALVRSRRCTERLELRINGEPFVRFSRAAARRQPEAARRLVLRTLPQRSSGIVASLAVTLASGVAMPQEHMPDRRRLLSIEGHHKPGFLAWNRGKTFIDS